jgi:hypothetical protein
MAALSVCVLAFGNREGPERAPEIFAQMGEGGVCAGVGELPGYRSVLYVVSSVWMEEISGRGVLRECTG